MVRTTLTALAFLSLLVFLLVVLRVELDLSFFVSGLLSVSVLSIGFMLALALQLFVGLDMLATTVVLGLLMFVTAGTYEMVT
jgi:hypothetical protein